MKLKPLFILLNIVLIAAVVLCFFSIFSTSTISLFANNGSSALSLGFLVSSIICLVILVLLIIADVFFIFNSKMFECIMEENWQELAIFFEHKMLEKGRFSKYGTALFINVLVMLSDYTTLCKLFEKLKNEKLALYKLFAPDFIAASLVFANISETASFISSFLKEDNLLKPKERNWVKLYSAFIAYRNGKYKPASKEFASLALSSGEPIVYAVSGYFCAKLIPAKTFGVMVSEEELFNAASVARKKIQRSFSHKRWEDYCVKMRKKVRIAVIFKTIELTANWIFNE